MVASREIARATRGGGEAHEALPSEGAREGAPLNDYSRVSDGMRRQLLGALQSATTTLRCHGILMGFCISLSVYNERRMRKRSAALRVTGRVGLRAGLGALLLLSCLCSASAQS